MTYEKLISTSARLHETNDCAVIALAAVLRLSYEAVHRVMEEAGRQMRDGTPRSSIERAIAALGFRIRRRYSAKRLGLEVGLRRKPRTSDPASDPEAWKHLPNLLIFIEGHALALVDGKVQDWTHDREAPIQEAWEIEWPRKYVNLKEAVMPVVYL